MLGCGLPRGSPRGLRSGARGRPYHGSLPVKLKCTAGGLLDGRLQSSSHRPACPATPSDAGRVTPQPGCPRPPPLRCPGDVGGAATHTQGAAEAALTLPQLLSPRPPGGNGPRP